MTVLENVKNISSRKISIKQHPLDGLDQFLRDVFQILGEFPDI